MKTFKYKQEKTEAYENLKGDELSVYAFNALYSSGITSLEQLSAYTPQEILRRRNIGKKVYQEVIALCAKYNVKLKDSPKKVIEPRKRMIVLMPLLAKDKEQKFISDLREDLSDYRIAFISETERKQTDIVIIP